MAKLEKPKLNKPSQSVTDKVIGQMIASEPAEAPTPKESKTATAKPAAKKSEKKMVYSKDENGNTVGANGNKIGRPKVKKKKVQLSFSVTEDLRDQLTAYCNDNNIPLSLAMSFAAKEYLEKHS